MQHFSLPSFRPRTLALPVLAALLLTSCGDNEDVVIKAFDPDIFVLSQGNFGTPNGSVTAIERTGRRSEKDFFQAVNARPLGDVVQSMSIMGERGYIVVNNSNKVEVVRLPDFGSVGTIGNVRLPRYMVAASPSAQKAYLTEWVAFGQNGRVAVLNLLDNTVSSTIPVGQLPEKPLLVNGRLFVPNSSQNTVTVINTNTDQVETTLTVSDGPNSVVQDATGNIWVLCGGITRYNPQPPYNVISSTPAKLVRLNGTAPYAATRTLSFTASGAANLLTSPNRQQLYYRHAGAVYRIAATDTALATTPHIRRRFNGIGIDPVDGTLYGGVGSFTAEGRAVHYSLTGARLDSVDAGIGPSEFAFR